MHPWGTCAIYCAIRTDSYTADMPILFRWIFFSCLSRAAGTLIALLALFSIIELFDKSRYLGKSMNAHQLAEYILLKMPFMMTEFMPVIMLIAVSIYIAEISHHHEVVAMRAAGLGLKTVMLPVLTVGMLGTLLGLAISQWVTPQTNVRLDQMERVFIQHQAETKQGIQWIKDGERFFRLEPLAHNTFKWMMLQTDTKGAWLQRIDASHATYHQGAWQLQDVHISAPDAREGMQLRYQESMQITTSLSPDTADPPSPRHMALQELYQYADDLKRAGLNNTGFIFEFHHKIAVPASCVIMVLLAVALCMNMGSRIAAASWGLITAITLGLLFYVLSNASGLLATGERMPAAYAAWLPLLFFGGLTGFLLIHREGN